MQSKITIDQIPDLGLGKSTIGEINFLDVAVFNVPLRSDWINRVESENIFDSIRAEHLEDYLRAVPFLPVDKSWKVLTSRGILADNWFGSIFGQSMERLRRYFPVSKQTLVCEHDPGIGLNYRVYIEITK